LVVIDWGNITMKLIGGKNVSEKIYYQHLFKEILDDLETFDTQEQTPGNVDKLLNKIFSLKKDKKAALLLGKLQTKKNFLHQFSELLDREIDELTS